MADSNGRLGAGGGANQAGPAGSTDGSRPAASGVPGASGSRPGRGHLRIYLGSAAGVGKTYAMLGEGHRRPERGADVVVGFAEAHGRPQTTALLDGLETVPRARLEYRGATFEEMDIDAVLARRPEIALVDELAHTNVPGSRNEKRWQDVEELLDAGIDVISAVNIQHLESLNDVVEKITGVPQRETVPDAIVRAADQVEMVDMTPEALRRRMAHGNIYPPEKIDAALTNYFRSGNLAALRELALLWLADKVDEGLQRYRTEHKIQGAWEARERVVVALTGGPEGKTLIRRAARIAARSSGGDLLAVHVTKSDGLTGADPATLASQRRLVESVGGTYHQVVGDNIPEALLTFARAENATQLVLGASRRSWLSALFTGPGIGSRTIRGSGDIDVHIVTHGHMGRGRGLLPRPHGAITLRRKVAGYVLAAVLSLALTVVLASLRNGLNLTSDVLLFLVAVILVALVGGFAPAVLAAIVGSLLLNYYFTPPIHQWTISQANNALALGVFVAVALLVSRVVDIAARRTTQAARANAASELLTTTAGSVLRGQQGLSALLDRVREAFGMDSVTLLECSSPDGQQAADTLAGRVRGTPGGWHVVASRGEPAVTRPDEADVEVPVADSLSLALRGRPLPAADRRVLGAFASYAAVALDQQRLAAEAQAAKPIAAADRMRTALLAAVSHDLRTPLASAKAAVTSLRSPEVNWAAEDHDELLATADESLDRLSHLVDNLLDMSRLQAGALSLFPRPADLEEIVSSALDNLDPAGRGITVDIPESLPEINVDPAILERVIVNLTENALRYSPAGQPPLLTASVLGDRVELRVVDRGPGIPEEDRDRMFVPFQRLGDTDNTTGVGLGLALSRGLAEAMGGTLTAEDTPGGGLTMTVSVPAVTEPGYECEPGHRERSASEPEGRGAAWIDEPELASRRGRGAAWTMPFPPDPPQARGTSDEGPPPQAARQAERHLEAPPEASERE